MQSLKIIALLMEYPNDELWEAAAEIQQAVAQEVPQINAFADAFFAATLIDRQAEWCELFDRGRATSLLLFEHVHAESRDRGQAMVDLMAQYEKAGLQLDSRELPDWLPLYLEYLSIQPEPDALQGLNDVAPILALLGGRLKQRQSPYSQLFDALLSIAGSQYRSESVASQVVKEARDDTPQALDAIWEEEQVKFIDDQGCSADTSPQQQRQRRFSDNVTPQYLDISAGGQK